MTAHALVAEAAALGIRIEADGAALVVAPASGLSDELRARIVAAKPALLDALRTNEADEPEARAPEPVADLARGRRLLDRLRWTRRHVGLAPDGGLVVRPRVGTADAFGREVAAHPDDIAAVLAAEVAGAVA